MAYGPKFRVEGISPGGHTYRADVEQEGYSGSVTTFTPAPDGIRLRWDTQRRQDLNEPWMIGRGAIRVKEEDPSPLAEIFDGGKFEYRVSLYQDDNLYFRGFANTDLYEDSKWQFLSDPRIEFTGGLGKLSDIAFEEAGSEEDVREAIMRVLSILPSDLKAEINMRWFPNGITSHPIEGLYVPDAAWNEDNTDTAPNPNPKRKTGRAVLRSLLRRFGMRLMQSGGQWRMRQRLSLMDDSLEVSTYDADGTRASTSTKTGRERDLTAYNADEEARSFQPEFGASSIKYVFANELGEVVPNGSFEEPIEEWNLQGGAQIVNVSDVSDMADTSNNFKCVKMDGSDHGANIDGVVRLPQDPRVAMELRWRDVRDEFRAKVAVGTSSGHDLFRRSEGVIAPALAGKETTINLAGTLGEVSGDIEGLPIIPAGAELRLLTSDPSVSPENNSITLSEPVRVGDETVTGQLSSEIKETGDPDLYPDLVYWQWTTSSHSEFTLVNNDNFFTEHAISVFMTDATGAPVYGDVGINFFVGDPANVGFYALDDVSMTFERDGEQVRSFLTTTVDENGPREEQEVPVGIGPTDRSDSRIYTQSDETPQGWGRGSSGSSTLSELQTTESLQMQRTSPETRRFRLRLREGDQDVLPHHVYLDGPKRYEAVAMERDLLQGLARLNLAEVQDGGTSGLSTTTEFREDEAASSGGSGSSVQVIDGGGGGGGSPSWNDVTGKPGSLLAANGDSDGFPATQALGSADITGALGYTPADEATALTGGTGIQSIGDLSQDRTIGLADGGVNTTQLAPDAVEPAKVASGTYAIDISGDADTVDGYEGSDLAALSENESIAGTYDWANPNEWTGISGTGYEGYQSIPSGGREETEYILISKAGAGGSTSNTVASGTIFYGASPNTSAVLQSRIQFYWSQRETGSSNSEYRKNFYVEAIEDERTGASGTVDVRSVKVDWNGSTWAAIEIALGYDAKRQRTLQLDYTQDYDADVIQAKTESSVSNVAEWTGTFWESIGKRRIEGALHARKFATPISFGTENKLHTLHLQGEASFLAGSVSSDYTFRLGHEEYGTSNRKWDITTVGYETGTSLNNQYGNMALVFQPDYAASPVFAVDDADAIFNQNVGIQETSPSYPLDVGGEAFAEGLTSGGDVDPNTGYEYSIGSSQDKWLTLDVAELRVSTLVAEKELATVGGRQLVGTANELAEAVAAADASIAVKYNNLQSGDFLRLEGGGSVEFMKVTSSASGTGPYTYDVDRDRDGTGANSWDQGDGLFSTSQGEGFIDLYAEHSFTDAAQSTITGPTIAFRVQGAGRYADVSERAAVGNLRDTFGYTSDTYGIAAGDPDNDYFTADPSGIEFVDGQTNTVTAQLSSQVFSVGPNQNLKYDAAAGRLSVGDWTVNQTDIRSLPASGDAGLLLSTDMGMGRFQDSGATLRATSDVTDPTVGPFVELFVEDSGSFGLYAEDGSGSAVLGLGASPAGSNRSGDFFIDGDLLIDGSVTAAEIDVGDFWTADATVKNTLTMGSGGEIRDENDKYRIDALDGISLNVTGTFVVDRAYTIHDRDISASQDWVLALHATKDDSTSQISSELEVGHPNYEALLDVFADDIEISSRKTRTLVEGTKPGTYTTGGHLIGPEFTELTGEVLSSSPPAPNSGLRVFMYDDGFEERLAYINATGNAYTLDTGAPIN